MSTTTGPTDRTGTGTDTGTGAGSGSGTESRIGAGSRSRPLLRVLAIASLVMNVVIIVTGGLVRLTGSGLGCPTWPECVPGSYTPHPEYGIHGVIEFGNRLLTFVLIAIALATLATALFYRDDRGRGVPKIRWLAFAMTVGIPFQGVIGGITVLTQLNPYVVALHLLNSMVLVALSVWLVRLSRQLRPRPVRPAARRLAIAIFALTWVVVGLGTIVTGSGPHAGDENVIRNGLDPETISKLHAFAVYVLVAATVAAIVAIRNAAAVLLLLVEIGQGVIGFAQYFTGLPVPLVAIHLVGAAATIAAGANLCYSVTRSSVTDSSVTTSGSQPAAGPASGHPARSGSRSAAPRSPVESP